jgi:hypothetical protein
MMSLLWVTLPSENDKRRLFTNPNFMLINLAGSFVETSFIAVVRPSGKKKTIIFTSGQSSIDEGFLVDLPIDEVLELIDNARLNQIALDLARAEDANSTASHPPGHPDPELENQY